MNRHLSQFPVLTHARIDSLVAKYPFATEVKLSKKQEACEDFLAHFAPLKYVRCLEIKNKFGPKGALVSDDDLTNFTSTHPELCCLVLHWCTSVTEAGLLLAIAGCVNQLTALSIKSNRIDANFIPWIADAQTNLVRLDLSGKLDDDSLATIRISFDKLKRLRLKTTEEFSRSSVASILEFNKSLDSLEIGPCKNTDDPLLEDVLKRDI